jgi:hypothetical protein
MKLVYPMFAMVLLTFGTLLTLFRMRARFVREKKVDPRYFGTYQDGQEPEASAKLARHFSNLLEAPTLFYAACLAAIVTEQSTPLVIFLAWMYVAARVVHTFIHTGKNTLLPRIAAYFSSWAVLILIWISIVYGVATST